MLKIKTIFTYLASTKTSSTLNTTSRSKDNDKTISSSCLFRFQLFSFFEFYQTGNDNIILPNTSHYSIKYYLNSFRRNVVRIRMLRPYALK